MDFNDMRASAKRIDAQIKSLEAIVAHPMNMLHSNGSNQGVKVMSKLKGMIEDVETKRKYIELKIQEENLILSEMVEDYNSIAKFKTDIVSHLNDIENMWCSHYPDYKPFISHGHGTSEHEESDSLNNLSIQDDRFVNNQISDQFLSDSLSNITMS